jgi:DNA-binding NtrC family response regulator
VPQTATRADARGGGPRVVVVVEDDPDLRRLYAMYLEGEGFTVAQAANGLEALLQIKRVRPMSVVLDLLMPRLGGLEALRRIRAFDPSIRVVVVTGTEDPYLPQQALTLGASAVLKKPVANEALLSALTGDSPSRVPPSESPTTVPTAPPATDAPAGRVLVVDDEAEICALLEEFLVRKGYWVRSVADGAAALREVINEAPDLVLLDVDMPRLGGVEALTAIRAIARQVRVIMISGKASLETAKLALAYGAFDYIAKPFDLDHLSEVVAAAFLRDG